MWIVNLTANPNGSHDDHRADHITDVPDGWAMIPEGFNVPSTYPFVYIKAEEVAKEGRAHTVTTVTAMSEGVVPPTPAPEPTAEEKRDAQIFYTAMMTNTLLEEV